MIDKDRLSGANYRAVFQGTYLIHRLAIYEGAVLGLQIGQSRAHEERGQDVAHATSPEGWEKQSCPVDSPMGLTEGYPDRATRWRGDQDLSTDRQTSLAR